MPSSRADSALLVRFGPQRALLVERQSDIVGLMALTDAISDQFADSGELRGLGAAQTSQVSIGKKYGRIGVATRSSATRGW